MKKGGGGNEWAGRPVEEVRGRAVGHAEHGGHRHLTVLDLLHNRNIGYAEAEFCEREREGGCSSQPQASRAPVGEKDKNQNSRETKGGNGCVEG